MPDCNETLEELQQFLDGELPENKRDHVMAHLEECLECHQAFDFQAELKAVIAAKCREQSVPAALLDRIRSSFGQPPQ